MRTLIASIATLSILVAACGSVVGDGGPVTTAPETTTTTTAPPSTGGGDTTTTTTTTPGSTTTTQPGDTTTTQPQGERFVQIYLIQDGLYAKPVTRTVPGTVDVAANAIRALIEGPTEEEMDAGLWSSVPDDTLLLGIDLTDGVATVDLSREFESGGGSFAMLSRLAQVVYTLTQFDTIDEVVFWLDGEPVTVFSGEGILLEDPVDRSDYLSALPLEASSERWTQSDLPSTTGVDADDLRRVVLVTEDDTLNVRVGAGVDNDIIGTLDPDVTVIVTGDEDTAGSSVWAEIEVPGNRTGWVNATFLGAVVSESEFANDDEVEALLDRMAELMAAKGDLSEVASSRGIYIVHNARPVRFSPDDLETAMTDSTTYKWGSAALEPDSPELPSRTFAEAIGATFVSAYDDTDTSVKYNELELGGNGILPDFVIPFELRGFNVVSVYDPGDNPDYEGLDWKSWYVSVDYEDGEPKVVGMTINEWSP